MNFWTFDNLKRVLGATWVARPAESGVPLDGLGVDSRALRPGQAFLALRGERTDGHRYLREALTAGAALLIVERDDLLPVERHAAGVLRVPDAGAALLRLAGAYRRTLDTTKVIAVGGSNGKTTTVRLVHRALSASLRGSASPKSFNNAVGVPLTILAARRSDQFLVCEVGTNASGEIEPLSRVVEPDLAVITSIGREHLEGLGSLEGVLAEETRLLAGLRPHGAAILNADAEGLVQTARPLLAGHDRTIVTFGRRDDADLRLTAVEPSPDGLRFCLNARAWYDLPLLGGHNAWNAAAAVAVARRLGVGDDDVARALAGASGAPMRLERARAGGVLFINDAYNANPESVLAALRAFGESFGARPGPASGGGRRVVVLGDMLELGPGAPALHAEVGAAVGASDWLDLAVFVGPLSCAAADAARAGLGPARVRHVEDAGGTGVSLVAGLLREGDTVLLKGSRRMALERVIAGVGPGAMVGEPTPSASVPGETRADGAGAR